MDIRMGHTVADLSLEAYVRGEDEPRQFRLSSLRGNWVVLFFYPRDFTFICPTEIQSFAELEALFQLEGAIVLGASTDSYHSHKAWYETDERLARVDYLVIADSNHSLSRAFGVLLEETGEALRGTFIIDPDGILRHIQINDLDVGRNGRETLRVLQALRTGQLCPHAWQPGQPTLTQQMTVVPV